MSANDPHRAVSRVRLMVWGISAPQWVTWIAGSALALGLLAALAAVTSV